MKTGVLLIDEENGSKLIQQRLKYLGVTNEMPIYILPLSGFILSDESIEQIINYSKEKNIGLVIFDSLVRIHSGDENSSRDIAKVFKLLKELTKHDLTVICTHHNRKQGFLSNNPSQSMRGSSDILASVDCHLAVERNQKEGHITIRQTKLRHSEEARPFQLNVIADDTSFKFEYAGELDESQDKLDECKEAIKEILENENKPLYKQEIFESLRKNGLAVGKTTFKKAIDEMVSGETLYEKKGEKNKVYVSLKPFEEEMAIGQKSTTI